MKRWIAMLCIWALPWPAWAWGQEGHSIVAELAQRRLSPAASAQVRLILGGDVSLASVSTWADDVRSLRRETSNEHFVNIPLAVSAYAEDVHCNPTPRGDCVVKAIPRILAQLVDPTLSPEHRRDALKYLVHFVADLHQPFHTVSDLQGGNGLAVVFFVDPARQRTASTNLHAVWDYGLIRALYYAWGSYVDSLEQDWFAGRTAAELTALGGGSVAQWAIESHRAAQSMSRSVVANATLGEPYLALARPVLDRQLALAALRLAALLNERLK